MTRSVLIQFYAGIVLLVAGLMLDYWQRHDHKHNTDYLPFLAITAFVFGARFVVVACYRCFQNMKEDRENGL